MVPYTLLYRKYFVKQKVLTSVEINFESQDGDTPSQVPPHQAAFLVPVHIALDQKYSIA